LSSDALQISRINRKELSYTDGQQLKNNQDSRRVSRCVDKISRAAWQETMCAEVFRDLRIPSATKSFATQSTHDKH
jgi:hypothetical protein